METVLKKAGHGELRPDFQPGCDPEQTPGIITPLPRLVSADPALDIGDREREEGLRRAREEAGSDEKVGKRLSLSASARVGGRNRRKGVEPESTGQRVWEPVVPRGPGIRYHLMKGG